MDEKIIKAKNCSALAHHPLITIIDIIIITVIHTIIHVNTIITIIIISSIITIIKTMNSRDTMAEDRTSAQNLCPEDETSSG